ncbi:MAG: 3-deoxy-manno-octulosonate cytidylyltransferase [Candidatus Latescibacterota bacterium]|nr:MAG: 3-deoxy-manno-octulosonate cytidylyltransferase [Candidatus Latescibacterota bacterium]
MARSESGAAAVIPARIGSTRLPRKPLQTIAGREIVLRVCDAAARARLVDVVVVATDAEEIASVVRGAGYEARLTSPDHATGTDRVAEAARGIDSEIVVNIQGDEPFLPPGALDRVIEPMIGNRSIEMRTLVVPLEGEADLADPNTVKVVVNKGGTALYFSRAPIPHPWAPGGLERWKHVGVYAFRRETLFRFVSLERTALEKTEGLEQLRALDHGIAIDVAFWPEAFHGVETLEDLERARAALSSAAGGPRKAGPGKGSA